MKKLWLILTPVVLLLSCDNKAKSDLPMSDLEEGWGERYQKKLEDSWAEDLGSGTRNILRYAPIYYPGYKIEINSGQQFVFSITYQDENVQGENKISKENVTIGEKMSKGNVQGWKKMSKDKTENVQGKMSKDVPELTDDELALPLEPFERQSVRDKKNRRRQAIIGMIAKDSHVSLKVMSEKLDVNIKTIWRDLNELKSYGVIERIGDDFTGEWNVVKKKNDK